MKTKVLLLALLSGFVFSVAAQEYQPQVGFSNEAGYKTNFKKNKARDNWFISIAGGASVLLGDQNRRVRHAASFATVGGQTGLSDNDGSFRRANQPDRPQCFCRCGHVGRLFLARLGKQL